MVLLRPSKRQPRKVRYSAASVKAQRKRLGLSAANFGKLIGGLLLIPSIVGTGKVAAAQRPGGSLRELFEALERRKQMHDWKQLRAKVTKGRKKKG